MTVVRSWLGGRRPCVLPNPIVQVRVVAPGSLPGLRPVAARGLAPTPAEARG